jgi:hypothetical protein
VDVPLSQLDGTPRCGHEVRIVMKNDEIVMGGCGADLEVTSCLRR